MPDAYQLTEHRPGGRKTRPQSRLEAALGTKITISPASSWRRAELTRANAKIRRLLGTPGHSFEDRHAKHLAHRQAGPPRDRNCQCRKHASIAGSRGPYRTGAVLTAGAAATVTVPRTSSGGRTSGASSRGASVRPRHPAAQPRESSANHSCRSVSNSTSTLDSARSSPHVHAFGSSPPRSARPGAVSPAGAAGAAGSLARHHSVSEAPVLTRPYRVRFCRC